MKVGKSMNNKILVVDDQPGICLLLQDVLTTKGYEVTIAQTGKEALDLFEDHSFDLMIIDYQLPVLTGKEVIQKLEQRNNKTPVIVMTGLIENVNLDHEQTGFHVEMIAKPFDIDFICDLVKKRTAAI